MKAGRREDGKAGIKKRKISKTNHLLFKNGTFPMASNQVDLE